MNPDAQRIAVAEVRGWSHVHYARDLSESTGTDCFRGHPPGRRDYYDNVPDYLNEQNAAHDVLHVLHKDEIQWAKYRAHMHRFYLANDTFPPSAAQICEGVLHATGRWIDD
jgi:hypothetical protein